jgi:hypothetical protein
VQYRVIGVHPTGLTVARGCRQVSTIFPQFGQKVCCLNRSFLPPTPSLNYILQTITKRLRFSCGLRLCKVLLVVPLLLSKVEFMNVFSRRRVDSQSLRSTPRYESTLMEFTNNLPKPPEFVSIQTITKDEWTCLNEIIN